MSKVWKVWAITDKKQRLGEFFAHEDTADESMNVIALTMNIEPIKSQGYFVTKEKLHEIIFEAYEAGCLNDYKGDSLQKVFKNIGIEWEQ